MVVVNGGVTANGQARSPGHHRTSTTTIPVGDGGGSNGEPLQGNHLKASPGRKSISSRGGGLAGEGKRATHEKNKSVTIVVNDQQVSQVAGEARRCRGADGLTHRGATTGDREAGGVGGGRGEKASFLGQERGREVGEDHCCECSSAGRQPLWGGAGRRCFVEPDDSHHYVNTALSAPAPPPAAAPSAA